MTIKITVESEPKPAPRPRFTSRRYVYQPARNLEYRKAIELAASQVMQGAEPLTGALAVDISLFRRYQPTSRRFGDVDNHAKALLDGLQGIVFVDDAQIVQCSVSKFKDKEMPRAEITIKELT